MDPSSNFGEHYVSRCEKRAFSDRLRRAEEHEPTRQVIRLYMKHPKNQAKSTLESSVLSWVETWKHLPTSERHRNWLKKNLELEDVDSCSSRPDEAQVESLQESKRRRVDYTKIFRDRIDNSEFK